MSDRDAELSRGFPPVFDADARRLVLGSMPGVRSLEAAEYYAHPRNAFWPLMERLFGVPVDARYEQRLAGLRANGVALWDVIGECRRRGSLDQRIERDSIVVNDFGGLLERCPDLELVAFNGRTAADAWRRYVAPSLGDRGRRLATACLPSTSPAHAAMTFDDKLAAWRHALGA